MEEHDRLKQLQGLAAACGKTSNDDIKAIGLALSIYADSWAEERHELVMAVRMACENAAPDDVLSSFAIPRMSPKDLQEMQTLYHKWKA